MSSPTYVEGQGAALTSAELAKALLESLLREREEAHDAFRIAQAAKEKGELSQEEYRPVYKRFDRAAQLFHDYREWHYQNFLKGTEAGS